MYTGAMDGRTAKGILVFSALPALFPSCGDDSPVEPAAVDVRVAYVSRLPPGCPDGGNICYPMCAHHNAPAGLQAIVPLWGADTLRLTETATGRSRACSRPCRRTRRCASTDAT